LRKELFLALLLAAAPPCRADITLPALISDNMVLQQHARVNVWGRADPGESVTVQLGEETAQTIAGTDGAWAVKLAGLKSGGPYDLIVSGKNSLTVHNVAVGDVWLCGGESNMEFKVVAARNGPEEMEEGSLPMVREFVVSHNAAAQPQSNCQGTWVVCDPATAGDFSAIAFFFARELNPAMRLPMGLIQTTWGPSPAEAWTPRSALESDPLLHPVLDRYGKAAAAYPGTLSAYQARLADWNAAAAAAARAAGSPPPRKPVAPLPPGGQREPSALYNGMISPLQRYAIRGVLWYQGESDTADPLLYRTLFPAMITAWRKGWGEGDFPFLYVQLPGFLARHAEPSASLWAQLREAQAAALALPKTGMAVTIDLGDQHNMHPPGKQDVAHRLALLAESAVYGKPGIAASGPLFDGMEIEDGAASLSFTHLGGGLVAKNGPPLRGFSIAGADRKFVWADAEIRGEKVIVRGKDVPQPAAVRYAWADFPDCDLFNRDNLPAAPFRTDDWLPGDSAAPAPSATPSHRKHHAKRAQQ